MRTKICSCQGLDANCKNCFGSGYIHVQEFKNTEKSTQKKKKSEIYIPNDLGELTQNEVEELAVSLINALDVKSKKQMQILNSIPFNTTIFRRDFGSKFDDLEFIENEKQHLRNELFRVDQEIVLKNYKSNFKFKHYLSDKDVNARSNRELKTLIREYRRLKAL